MFTRHAIIAQHPWLALFPLVALIAAILAVYSAYDTYRVSRDWKSATASVVDLEAVGRRGFSPVLEFSFNDSTYRFRSNVASSPAPYAIGEDVEILFDPTDPVHAVIDSFGDRYVGVIVGGILTVAFTLAGLLAVKLMSRSGTSGPLHRRGTAASSRWLVYVSPAFLLVGLVCGTIATMIGARQYEAGSEWKRVEGEVIDSWSRGGTMSQSLVRYVADDGREYTAVFDIDSWSEYTPGEKVMVVYDPERPGSSMPVGEIGPGFAFWLLAILSILFLAAGVAVFIMFRRS
jgi:hypothetical protein